MVIRIGKKKTPQAIQVTFLDPQKTQVQGKSLSSILDVAFAEIYSSALSVLQNLDAEVTGSAEGDKAKEDRLKLQTVGICCNVMCKKMMGSSQLKRCTRCQKSRYCSVDCQKADWKDRHKAECSSA
mmetsp:Transcript_45642/g.71513  ORF Transcript_45642/g.71513 Transcript_45642/m.71513 type:complete len:126 (+) Transcript_45642:693-1070(+)